MTCPVCGRYAEPDRETGYDSDDVMCGECQERQEYLSDKVDPIESDLHDLGSVLASLADLVKDCHDPAKLFDVYNELTQISRGVTGLQDAIARKHLGIVRLK